MQKLICLLAIICIISIISCNSNKYNTEQVVLEIGKCKIYSYQFQKELAIVKKHLNKAQQENWLNGYINNAYLIAEGLYLQFDTLSAIQNSVNGNLTSKICEVGGYVWKIKEEPKLQISVEKLKETYAKRNKLYFIEVLCFRNREIMCAALGNDTIIKDAKSFASTIYNCKPKRFVSTWQESIQWPFLNYYTANEQIWQLKEGQISAPLNIPQGVAIIKLIKVETINQLPLKKEKEKITAELQKIITEQIFNEKRISLKQISDYKIADLNITTVEKFNSCITTFLNNQTFTYNDTSVLASYNYCNKREIIRFNDLLKYCYYSVPAYNLPVSKEDIENFIIDFIDVKYTVDEAIQLGITKSEEFHYDSLSLVHQHILQRLAYNLEKNLNVPEDEMLTFYESNVSRFTIGKTCNIHLFYFKNRQSLLDSWGYINSQYSQGFHKTVTDTHFVHQLLKYEPNQIIDKHSKLHKQLVTDIFTSPVNYLHLPATDYNGENIIFYKTGEEGKEIRPFSDVRADIEKLILEKKHQEAINTQIQFAKKKFTVKTNTISDEL